MSKKPTPNPHFVVGSFNGKEMCWIEMYANPVPMEKPAVEPRLRIPLSEAEAQLSIDKLKRIYAERIREALPKEVRHLQAQGAG